MNHLKNKAIILGAGIAVVASAAFALNLPSDSEILLKPLPVDSVVLVDQPMQPVIQIPVIENEPQQADSVEWIELRHRIQKGESLALIFNRLSLSKTELHQVIHTNELAKQFARISPGKELVAKTNESGELQELSYLKNAFETLKATRVDGGFQVELQSKSIERQISSAHVVINNSLYVDGKEAGLSDKLIMQLADVFAWDIDLALSLRKGDAFTMIYENLYVDGRLIDSGHILSAEFVNQGNSFTALRFEDKAGHGSYFTPEGKSMRKTFLRTPVDFARISSRFNLRRKHPVLNRIRAHKGVDYAARTGTPIKTTGDGKIIYRGRKGGYGRVVIVQHGQKYQTLYAHLSKYKRGQKNGTQVKQGQVIGYVGKSGLATGPHLHYEFRVNGVHRNPLTVKLPQAKPIEPGLLAEFKLQTRSHLARLNEAKLKTLLASK